jgi:YD repeat-containing protein
VSATNPENGTVTYTYDGAHHVLTRTDAKGQVTGYSYDTYGRLSTVNHYAPGNYLNSPDPNQQVNYSYDTSSDPNAYNTWGRLATVTFGNTSSIGYQYTYGYNPAGRATYKTCR